LRRSRALCAAISGLLLCLCGCSGGSYSSTSSYQEFYPGEVQSGLFKPGNVAGLDFVSGDQAGVTDTDGSFTCATTQQVSFSIGSLELGDALCATIVHPASFSADGSLMDVPAINMARFLMLLDADQNFDNGIVIPQSLRDLADTWPAIDFAAMDFEGQLIRVMADIASVEARPDISVPPSAAAFAYLESSLSCAYSGIFVNTFAAGPFLAPTDVALAVSRKSSADAGRFTVQISRKHPQSFMYLDAEGSIEMQTLPELVNDPAVGRGSIVARYLTPDIVAGTWNNATAQQSIDRIGSFEALRIGRGAGQFRLVGSFSAPVDTSIPILLGIATFILDGDTMTGEMFDLAQGAPFQVSGRRLPNSNSIEFSDGRAMGTAIATLVLDENSVPVSLQGAWPGVDDSTLDMDGCRMN
jgi:hypothetical protein